jgi:hypothetical protein
MARFHAGYNTSMPVTCAWWLDEYLEDHDIDASVSGILDDEGKAITSKLDEIVVDILKELGENPGRGADRWAEVLA